MTKPLIKAILGAKCRICGGTGHQAGFDPESWQYTPCPNKACYLCKQHGHTTEQCPLAARPASQASARRLPQAATHSLEPRLWRRRATGRQWHQPRKYPTTWRVSAALLRVHPKRVTAAAFHSSLPVVATGDKHGSVAVWPWHTTTRHVWSPHRYYVYGLAWTSARPDAALLSASADGMVQLCDVQIVTSAPLLTLNDCPWSGDPRVWCMATSVAASQHGWSAAGDDRGRLWLLDERAQPVSDIPGASGVRGRVVASVIGAHKAGSKVLSLQLHPRCDTYLLSAGSDRTAKLWDVRAMQHPVCTLQHPRSVPGACFSRDGNLVASSALDNRVRVWQWHALAMGDDNPRPACSIVHSHDFNRYLTPMRASFDPKAGVGNRLVIGRYISEPFPLGAQGTPVPLHPIDVLDVDASIRQASIQVATAPRSDSSGTGPARWEVPAQVVAELVDPLLTTIPSVTAVSPTDDAILAGSSTSVYIWQPSQQQQDGADEVEEGQQHRANRRILRVREAPTTQAGKRARAAMAAGSAAMAAASQEIAGSSSR